MTISFGPEKNDFANKKLTRQQIDEIRAGNLSLCRKLRFFMRYPKEVQNRLFEIAQHFRIDRAGVTLFKQGDASDGYYIIVKGTVKIEQNHLKYAHKKDMPPVVIRTCYDGDFFGEIAHFTANINKMNALVGLGTNTQE